MATFTYYKYRIYPNAEQQQALACNFGCKRWVWNYMLNLKNTTYQNTKKSLSYFDMSNMLPELKQQNEWLKDVDAVGLQQTLKDLDQAYKNWFNSISGKRKGSKVNAPTEKKKSNKQSYRTIDLKPKQDIGMVRLPKIGDVKCVFHRQLPIGKIKSGTVSMNPDGRYYISILVEKETEYNLLPQTGKEIGIDLGINNLAILSNGIKFDNPNKTFLPKTKAKIKQLQKKLSRTKKGSNNRKKARVKLAKAYSKNTRQRDEYYNQLSKWLVSNYDSIYIENLNINGMLKNKKLAKHIQDIAWGTLSGMIERKALDAGKLFHKINRFYPSSKTCSCCNHKLDSLPLNIREWECPNCGTHHDRDVNAAINVLNQGSIDVYETKPSVAMTEKATDDYTLLPTTLKKHASKIEISINQLDGLRGEKVIPQSIMD